MNFSKFYLFFFTSFFIISCKQAKDLKAKNKIQFVALEETTEDIGPPSLPIKPTFKTLQDWLINVCDSEKPQQPIRKFEFGLFESKNEFIVFLIGLNRYANNESIDYKPINTYFLLPQDEYKNLNREQVIDSLTTQLRDFTRTPKFESSFLSQSASIVFAGKTTIWTK